MCVNAVYMEGMSVVSVRYCMLVYAYMLLHDKMWLYYCVHVRSCVLCVRVRAWHACVCTCLCMYAGMSRDVPNDNLSVISHFSPQSLFLMKCDGFLLLAIIAA